VSRSDRRRKQALYLAAGAWNTVFGYGVFALFYRAGRTFGWGYLPALWMSQLLAIANAYVSYKFLVFRTRGAWLTEFARFSLVYWVVLAANTLALPALVRGLGWNPLAAQAAFTAATVVAGYFAHDRFSFGAPQAR
jgi:putative flippase GtrA